MNIVVTVKVTRFLQYIIHVSVAASWEVEEGQQLVLYSSLVPAVCLFSANKG